MTVLHLLDRFSREFGSDGLKREFRSWPWFAVPFVLLFVIGGVL